MRRAADLVSLFMVLAYLNSTSMQHHVLSLKQDFSDLMELETLDQSEAFWLDARVSGYAVVIHTERINLMVFRAKQIHNACP